MNIKKNITNVRLTLPDGVTLVVVSKTQPADKIMEAYNSGQRVFGENKAQELASKYDSLPKDIIWHMIGHLQTNKVKYIAPFVSLIHSIDSLKLLKEVNKQAAKYNRTINCLLQVHIAAEETKFGLSETELLELLNDEEFKKLTHIKILGLMGMATFTEDTALVKKEFAQLKKLMEKVNTGETTGYLDFTELSIGMSGDYLLAIEEGSTMVRIGSTIFGEREK